MLSSPPIASEKINVPREKVTSLRRHSSSIHSFAGVVLPLLAVVGSPCSLTEAWQFPGKRTCFPRQPL